MISNVEDAYGLIGAILSTTANEGTWQSLKLVAPILRLGLGGSTTRMIATTSEEVDIPIGLAIFDIQEAALFLRDDLLRTTGQRIWGLTFTLFPTGKFNIEYDYNKPDGYEESDETIDLAEALQGIGLHSGTGPGDTDS